MARGASTVDQARIVGGCHGGRDFGRRREPELLGSAPRRPRHRGRGGEGRAHRVLVLRPGWSQSAAIMRCPV